MVAFNYDTTHLWDVRSRDFTIIITTCLSILSFAFTLFILILMKLYRAEQ